MRPETLFMNPLAGPDPLTGPASPETLAPPAVFEAPPAIETLGEPLPEPEIPFRPQASREQRPGQQRTSSRARNGGRGNGRGRRAN